MDIWHLVVIWFAFQRFWLGGFGNWFRRRHLLMYLLDVFLPSPFVHVYATCSEYELVG